MTNDIFKVGDLVFLDIDKCKDSMSYLSTAKLYEGIPLMVSRVEYPDKTQNYSQLVHLVDTRDSRSVVCVYARRCYPASSKVLEDVEMKKCKKAAEKIKELIFCIECTKKIVEKEIKVYVIRKSTSQKSEVATLLDNSGDPKYDSSLYDFEIVQLGDKR